MSVIIRKNRQILTSAPTKYIGVDDSFAGTQPTLVWAANIDLYLPIQQTFATLNTAVIDVNSTGRCVSWDSTLSPKSGLTFTTNPDSVFTSSGQATIVLLRRKKDTTARASVAFGYVLAQEDRVIAHLPYSDGTSYFDFGTMYGGRLSAPSLSYTTEPECYVFVADSTSRGREIWRNGSLVASSTSETATRPSNTTSAFGLGGLDAYVASDSEEQSLFVVFPYALTQIECERISYNPWQIFKAYKKQVFSFGATTTHDSSGSLTGQGSALSGSANRFHEFSAAGALVGQGSALSGSAVHNIPHASSGDLVGQGSSVSGSADRQPPGTVSHDATGSLTGQGSTIAGSAARVHVFSASGNLVGQGSTIEGSAARTGAAVSHDATGDLVGPGSSISGTATNSGTSTLTPQDLLNIANAVWAHSSAVHCQLLMTEVWGRLGLDPAAPLTSGTTQITFGSIVMAMTEVSGSVTVTRQ
jgi:hypothetical protein